MKFEEWMVGQEVTEIATGDRGIITRECDFEEGVYINWKDGISKGYEQWLSLDDITFNTTSVAGKLAQIEKLVAEIRVLLEGK